MAYAALHFRAQVREYMFKRRMYAYNKRMYAYRLGVKALERSANA
jgi:hypothetical protein